MSIALPAYVDREAWDGFVEMRRAMPKSRPFTARAAKLILYELQRIKDAGHDANAALDQSTLNGWADVYVPKDKTIARAPESGADRTRQEIEQARAREVSRPPDILKSLVQRLKMKA